MLANRVLETSVTGGTGDLVLDGAVLGYQNFVVAIGDGKETYYTIWDEATGDWEIGRGLIAGGVTPLLIREEVLDSSAGDARVAFLAQQKFVFVDLPASERVFRDTDGSYHFFRKSATQTAPIVVLQDETGAVMGGVDAKGHRYGTLNNRITTDLVISVVKTGGSATADPLKGQAFDDLVNALAWCQGYRFSKSVRIDVGAGEWTYGEGITLAHPDGHLISVWGATPAVPLSSALTAPAATFEPDRNNPVYQARSGNMYNDAGQLPANANEATRTATRANDGVGNRAFLRTVLPTTFKFTVPTNGVTIDSNWGAFSNIYLEGAGGGEGAGLYLTHGNGLSETGSGGDRAIVCSGFYYGIYLAGQAVLWQTRLCAFDCGTAGIDLPEGASLIANQVTVQGNAQNGFTLNGAMAYATGGVRCAGNGASGLTLGDNASFRGGNVYVDGNGYYGAYVARGSMLSGAAFFAAGSGFSGIQISLSKAEFSNGAQAVGNSQVGLSLTTGSGLVVAGQINGRYNATHGMYVEQSAVSYQDLVCDWNGNQGLFMLEATASFASLSFTGNGEWGIYADGSVFRASNCNFISNVVGCMNAGNGAIISFFAWCGASGNGNGNLAMATQASHIRVPPGAPFSFSPAGGVWGNNDSLIYN